MRGLYAGSDLHGNTNLVGIMDEQEKMIFKKRLPNEPHLILEGLKPYKEERVGVVVFGQGFLQHFPPVLVLHASPS